MSVVDGFESIRNHARAKQLVSFDGMVVGKRMWPTDIDAVIDWKDRAWLIFEVKHGSKDVPLGQRLALERLVHDSWRGGKPAVAAIVEHDVDDASQDVRLADCNVRAVLPCDKDEWRPPMRQMTARELTNAVIRYVDGKSA